jgi:hypothetical protein
MGHNGRNSRHNRVKFTEFPKSTMGKIWSIIASGIVCTARNPRQYIVWDTHSLQQDTKDANKATTGPGTKPAQSTFHSHIQRLCPD